MTAGASQFFDCDVTWESPRRSADSHRRASYSLGVQGTVADATHK